MYTQRLSQAMPNVVTVETLSAEYRLINGTRADEDRLKGLLDLSISKDVNQE